MRLMERITLPESLDDVTTRSPHEVDARSVGVAPDAVERIWNAAVKLYGSRVHPAVQLCVRRHGEVIIDRAIGHARGNGPDDNAETPKVLATPDTPMNIFSASKAITAMVIHLLDQKHLLHVDDLVTEYIPEFGKHGKEKITIEHVLTHRAGIPNLPPDHLNLDYLADSKEIVGLLCDAEPTWVAGRRLAYHAITGGFILAEIVQRITGKTIRQVMQDEILGPLGFRWMNYGVKPQDVDKVALNYFTGPLVPPPVNIFIRRVLGLDMRQATAISNEPRFLKGIIPSANVITTANELSRFYQLLLNGGELDGQRIFEPRTIHRATSEQSYLEIDFMLAVPLRYSMGFMLGGLGLYGPDTPNSFGHVGFLNIFSWADPDRQVSVALINTGKPLLYPELYHLYDLMWQISSGCSKEPPRVQVKRKSPVRAVRTRQK